MSVAASDARELEVVTDVVAGNKTPAFSQSGKVLHCSVLSPALRAIFHRKIENDFLFLGWKLTWAHP